MDEQLIGRPEFVHRLWDGLNGVAALALGSPKLSDGKYTHASMRHTYFDYSAAAAQLLAFVEQAENGSHDVYFCPALRNSPSVKRNTATASRFLWADVDRPIEQVAPALEWLAGVADGLMLVRSGSGGAHVYVPLSNAAPMAEVEVLNRLVAAYLGGDSKWYDNALLRLPGTFNHKNRVLRGGAPTPVRAAILTVNGGGDLAGVDSSHLSAALGNSVASPAPSMSTKHDTLSSPAMFTPLPFLQQIIDETPGKNRSIQTYRLVFACIEFGATDAEVHWATLNHEPTMARFAGREQHLETEILRLIEKARAEHPHPGQSCAAARCPKGQRRAPQRDRRPVRRTVVGKR